MPARSVVYPTRFLPPLLLLLGPPLLLLLCVTPLKLDGKCSRLSFQVTNAQHPDALRALRPVTQLYLSIDAATESDLKRLGKTVIPSPVAVFVSECASVFSICVFVCVFIFLFLRFFPSLLNFSCCWRFSVSPPFVYFPVS